MGYVFDPAAAIPANIDYYTERTSHGSTLSRVVDSWVLARANRPGSWELFESALRSDIGDIQGGTTAEGIHVGAMAGTVDLIQRCYTGIELRQDVLWLNPSLPEALPELKLRIRYRSHWIALWITQSKLVVSFLRGWSPQVHVGVGNQVYEFAEGDEKEFSLGPSDGRSIELVEERRSNHNDEV